MEQIQDEAVMLNNRVESLERANAVMRQDIEDLRCLIAHISEAIQAIFIKQHWERKER